MMQRRTILLPLFLPFISVILCGCHSTPDEKAPESGVRLGAIVSLGGPAGEQGRNWLRGVELAVADARREGTRVEFFFEDDNSEPKNVAAAFTKLSRVHRVQGIIGGTWDYLGEAAYPVAAKLKVPFVTPTNPIEVLSDGARKSPYVFSNSLSLEAIKNELARLLMHMGAKRVGIIYPNLPFGQRQASVVEQLAKERGFEVVLRHEFPVSGAMADTVRIATLKLEEQRPDATFFVLDYNGLDLLTAEFKRRAWFPTVITTQHLDQAFRFSRDPERYKSLYAIYPRVRSSDFDTRYEERFGEPPPVFSHHGYDAAKFLMKAIEAGIDWENPQAFEVEGLTGLHVLPALRGALSNGEAKGVTTQRGKFEALDIPHT